MMAQRTVTGAMTAAEAAAIIFNARHGRLDLRDRDVCVQVAYAYHLVDPVVQQRRRAASDRKRALIIVAVCLTVVAVSSFLAASLLAATVAP